MDDSFKAEKIFYNYLRTNGYRTISPFYIGKKNLDFEIIDKNNRLVLSDVKIVKQVKKDKAEYEIDAHSLIRKDIKSLREKLKEAKEINCPVILISMNFSSKFYTSFTMSKAMFGEVITNINKKDLTATEPRHAGKAVFTKKHNTKISGIFVFDYINNKHIFFHNPYASVPLPVNYFPNVEDKNIYGYKDLIILNGNWDRLFLSENQSFLNIY